MIHNNIEDLIGNTPLLKLRPKSHGLKHIDVYVKLEYLNPFGSIKDRTVLGLTRELDFDRMRDTGAGIIESSSGNTAKAMQIIASRNSVPFTSVTNRVKVPEVDQLLRHIGANIVSLPGKSECPDPNQEDNAVARIEAMQRQEPEKYVHTEQYTNRANPAVHTRTTAQELYDDLETIDYIVTGVGTGGSSGGLINHINEQSLSTKVFGVVSHPSDFIPGIRTKNELFETALFEESWFEDIVEIESKSGLKALDILIRDEGVLAGPTTGASFAGLLRTLQPYDTPNVNGGRRTAVFIACDRLESYMSYIMKRLPERFNLNSLSDIYNAHFTTASIDISKHADSDTLTWINDAHATVVDIRGVKPYQAFHIAGSTCYPEEILKEVLHDSTPFDRERPILFVCPKGDRSVALARVLTSRGLKAYSLEGGLLAWRSAELPLERMASHG